MSEYAPETRELARIAETATRWGAKLTGLFGLGFAANGDVNGASLLIFQVGFAEILAMAAKGVAEDPPRGDFERKTFVPPQRVRPDVLAEIDEFDGWALRRALATDEAGRYLTASRVAFERHQGALRRRRAGLADARADEAVRYAHDAARALRLAAESTAALYDQIGDGRRYLGAFQWARLGDFREMRPDGLPADVLARHYLGGLPFSELDRLLSQLPRNPEALLAEPENEYEALLSLAHHLEGWRPPDPSRPRPG